MPLMNDQTVPGPMGKTPAPGNPPTASNPQGSPAVNPFLQAMGAQQGALESVLSPQIAGLQAGYQQQLGGLNQQGAAAQGETATSNAQALQSLNDTLASLGIQRTGLGQEQAYEQGQYGLTQQQYGLQQQGLGESLQNLLANYGLQQQGFGLQQQQLGLGKKEAQQAYGNQLFNIESGGAGSGTLGTGSEREQKTLNTQQLQNALASLGIQQGQLGLSEKGAAQAEKYGLQQNQLAGGQLGIQEKQGALSNSYQQQQLQNALQQLGLQGTQAQQGYQNTTQANQFNLGQQMAGLAGQQGQLQTQTSQAESGLYDQLLQAFGGG